MTIYRNFGGSQTKARFLIIYLKIFLCTSLLCVIAQGKQGVGISIVIAGILTVVVMFLCDKTGAVASGTLYGTGSSKRSLREINSAMLSQARIQKSEKRYDKALGLVNEILEKDPNYPDVLFLKGQIMWDGFQNSEAAKGNYRKVMELVPNKAEPLHRWASTCHDELNAIDKSKETIN